MIAQVALPVVIAIAAVVVVPAAAGRRQWDLAVGYSCAGAGVALQAAPVYRLVDPLLGGRNWANLAYHLLTVAGIAAFVLLLLTSDPARDRRRDLRLVRVATAAALVVQAGLFVLGSVTAGWGGLDPHLSEANASPLVIGYASVLWLALTFLACAAIVTQRSQTKGRPWSLARVGTTLIVAGSVVALLWCGNALTVAVSAAVRDLPGEADPVGPVLALLGGGSVFAGLGLTNLPHAVARLWVLLLEAATRPLWRRAVAAAPEVTLHGARRRWPGARATLYRHWVEIEDAVRLGRLDLSQRDAARVGSMQRLFSPAATSGFREASERPR